MLYVFVIIKCMEHSNHMEHSSDVKQSWTDWIPLVVVIAFIIISTVTVAYLTAFTLYNLLSYSMGFFFIYFSLFKMINLAGFAEGYHEYDLIAQKQKWWGFVYPFIELLLGVLYLAAINQPALHIVTIILTAVNCLGVGIKLAKKEKFHCACLGTVLKVPLTKVSLVEYASMGVMAFIMLGI